MAPLLVLAVDAISSPSAWQIAGVIGGIVALAGGAFAFIASPIFKAGEKVHSLKTMGEQLGRIEEKVDAIDSRVSDIHTRVTVIEKIGVEPTLRTRAAK